MATKRMVTNKERIQERYNLGERDFSGIDLARTNLRGIKLQRARLVGANFEGTDLQEVDLEHADLTSANLKDTNLSGANLNSANLEFAELDGALIGQTTKIEQIRMDAKLRSKLRTAKASSSKMPVVH